MIRREYLDVVALYTLDGRLPLKCWNEIQEAHENEARHYHNLHHLDALCELLIKVKSEIRHWPSIVFSIAYHDFVYDAYSSTNELESANLAKDRLNILSVESKTIERVFTNILNTADHKPSSDPDCNFFLDADLSILGSAPPEYLTYTRNVRKEFAAVPWAIYRTARKKILQRFLELDKIFKTDVFREKFEHQARENITSEIRFLETTSESI